MDATTPAFSSSPLRSIPPHLLPYEGAHRRSPTPDPTSTAASSPSAAYAGLTLEGEIHGDLLGSTAAASQEPSRLSASRNLLGSLGETTRSSSPAKRTRYAMAVEHIEDIDAEMALVPSAKVIDEEDIDSQPPVNKQAKRGLRHSRDTSVDMLAYDDELPKDRMIDENHDTLPLGVSLTPQSGISYTSSTTMTSRTAATTPESRDAVLPSIDEQIVQVEELANRPIHDGQKCYVIAMEWLSRVQARGTKALNTKNGKEAMEGEIGPVDNASVRLDTDLTAGSLEDEAGEPFVPLKPGLQLGEDVAAIPPEAWELIMKWYGLARGSPIITRFCHNTSTSKTSENLQYELYPLMFTILKLPDHSEGLTMQVLAEKDRKPAKVLASRQELYQKFLKRAKATAGIDPKVRVRVWKILGGLDGSSQAGMLTPAQSRSTSPAPNAIMPVDPGPRLVLDVNSFVALHVGSQRELVDVKDETTNDKYNGHRNLDFSGLSQDEVIVLEEQIGGPAGGEWVSISSGSPNIVSGVPISITRNGTTTVSSNLKPKANIGSGRTSPAPSGMMTRGRAQKNGRARGTVGLGNLGNTCYMNSALQCVRSAEELTYYFLRESTSGDLITIRETDVSFSVDDKHKKELNPRNPLSHNGEVAKAYAGLLKELYGENSISSFSPRNFKQVIGRYGPSFSGYGQQDSQEFLLFLLDGLQEDLNRIHQKPYIEKPDSTDEMVHDPVALRAMADKCWDIYKARNDSVITDLFAGMYKSTVICPECDKVSIIFDPFNNLTLQLPVENVWSRTVTCYPLRARPIKVQVDIDKNATFLALKGYVCKRVEADVGRTLVAEIHKNRFFKMFEDNKSLSEESISDADHIGIFELDDIPTNYPPPVQKQKIRSMVSFHYNQSDDKEDFPEADSPLADKMLVSVFHRHDSDNPSRYQSKMLFGDPGFIILTREEAQDYDSILRKVLLRVATMTTKDILHVDDASDSESSRQEDSDTVLMTTDDADSSSDSKVQATSVHGEDGLVDVSMKDAGEEPPPPGQVSYPPSLSKPRHTPRMLREGEFLDSGTRALFDMKYFSTDEMVPTGWQSLNNESKDYPDIKSRIPKRRPHKDHSEGPTRWKPRNRSPGNSSTASDEDTDGLIPNAYSTETTEVDDSDELSSSCPFSRLPREDGKFHFSIVERHVELTGPDTEYDGGPLICLGEAIILDWTREAFDALFCGHDTGDDDMRGVRTWHSVETLPDRDLDAKRQLRQRRKRNGVALKDCLDEFEKSEILSESDAWYCPRCQKHRRASKKFELWKSPDILVIHLKRFSSQGRLRDKLEVLVDFPVEGLDLSARVAIQEDGKSPVYDLFAVDNHYGGLGGGHYTAFAKNFIDGHWYEYNGKSAAPSSRPQNSLFR